ncbi:helix-turn-helix domain-containing protein [Paucibacter sp. DJ1R-11]|uniref:helix-turn-helix domain-containing protein n=1 Tax=unclassified Roseateles TaxID=2626991 RepID=UPI0021E39E6E|nr:MULTISPECIES: helix-turn-helix transcriptional regulator [unclassified Roseateles]MCV2365843.1 helix-turn-helix domain-containing protein [Paucibacter sp. DJ1R-11]MCV2420288.1 helix-turn-helix domain-containing protein [Paucibacter sp. DJ4R-1]MCV2436767.1 helix-turn-helix domain-containing protein [Paucibacter sp. DJ2R-2]
MSVIGRRLKAARLRAGLSQERLGLEIGLEAESASARMNRYETGARVPALELIERVASTLNMPAAYFYTSDDLVAEILCAVHVLPVMARQEVLSVASGLADIARQQ